MLERKTKGKERKKEEKKAINHLSSGLEKTRRRDGDNIGIGHISDKTAYKFSLLRFGWYGNFLLPCACGGRFQQDSSQRDMRNKGTDSHKNGCSLLILSFERKIEFIYNRFGEVVDWFPYWNERIRKETEGIRVDEIKACWAVRRSLLLLQYYDNNKRLGAELLKEEKRISFLFFSPLSRIKLWTRKDWHKKRCHTHRGRERLGARIYILWASQ